MRARLLLLALMATLPGALAHGPHAHPGHEHEPSIPGTEEEPLPPPPVTLSAEPALVELAPGGEAGIQLTLTGPPDAEVPLTLALPEGLRGTLATALVPLGPSGFAMVPLRLRAETLATGEHHGRATASTAEAAFVVRVVAPPPAAPAVERAAASPILAVALGVALAAGALLLPRARRGAPILLALFTRMHPSRALEHPARRALHDLVRSRPGLTLREAQASLGLANGALAHHVGVLERAKLLAALADGRHRRLWPLALPRPAPMPTLRERILAALEGGAARGPSELARELGVSTQSVHHHLKRLAAEGQAGREGSGRRARYARRA